MKTDQIVKWGIVIFIIISLAIGAEKYVESQLRISYLKSGLEECPKNPGSYVDMKTIWVKSCKDYIETMRGHQ